MSSSLGFTGNQGEWSELYVLFKMLHEGKLYTGGIVYAFIHTTEVKTAMTLIENALISRNKKPFNFEFISPYDPEIEWEDDATEHFLDLYKEAEESNEVIFDEFFLYEKK